MCIRCSGKAERVSWDLSSISRTLDTVNHLPPLQLIWHYIYTTNKTLAVLLCNFKHQQRPWACCLLYGAVSICFITITSLYFILTVNKICGPVTPRHARMHTHTHTGMLSLSRSLIHKRKTVSQQCLDLARMYTSCFVIFTARSNDDN